MDLGFSLGTNEVLRNGCRWKISTADRALWKLGEELMLGVRSSAQLVKNLSATWETWVRSLGGGKIPWRRERLLTPVFWPGKFHGLYSLWGCKELDTTEQLSLSRKSY